MHCTAYTKDYNYVQRMFPRLAVYTKRYTPLILVNTLSYGHIYSVELSSQHALPLLCWCYPHYTLSSAGA